jgi:hypothetical protein
VGGLPESEGMYWGRVRRCVDYMYIFRVDVD